MKGTKSLFSLDTGRRTAYRVKGYFPSRGISAMRGGDLDIRKRFEGEVLPHLDALYTAALHLTGDKRRAADLCEKTVLRAYSLFPSSAAATDCRAWLLAILFGVFRARSPSHEQT